MPRSDVGDVQAEPDGSGRLLVGESKTDQESRGAVLYLGALTVSRVNAWLAAAGHQDGPLFRRVRRGGRCRHRGPGIRGHSLRVGGAQSLAAGGASIVEMQTACRWQSPAMPGHYARRASWQHGAPSLAPAAARPRTAPAHLLTCLSTHLPKITTARAGSAALFSGCQEWIFWFCNRVTRL